MCVVHHMAAVLKGLLGDPIDSLKNRDLGKHISQIDKDVKHQDPPISVLSQGNRNVGGWGQEC